MTNDDVLTVWQEVSRIINITEIPFDDIETLDDELVKSQECISSLLPNLKVILQGIRGSRLLITETAKLIRCLDGSDDNVIYEQARYTEKQFQKVIKCDLDTYEERNRAEHNDQIRESEERIKSNNR